MELTLKRPREEAEAVAVGVGSGGWEEKRKVLRHSGGSAFSR